MPQRRGFSSESNLVNFQSQIGGIVKAGPGAMELAGANNYSGGTNVSGGTLIFASAAALPATGNLAISAGATAKILNHGANPVIVLKVPTLTNNGLIDMTNNNMVIQSGSSL